MAIENTKGNEVKGSFRLKTEYEEFRGNNYKRMKDSRWVNSRKR